MIKAPVAKNFFKSFIFSYNDFFLRFKIQLGTSPGGPGRTRGGKLICLKNDHKIIAGEYL